LVDISLWAVVDGSNLTFGVKQIRYCTKAECVRKMTNDELISKMIDLLRGPTDLGLVALFVLSCRCCNISPSNFVNLFDIGNTTRVVSLDPLRCVFETDVGL
jgi:hypothetical protein